MPEIDIYPHYFFAKYSLNFLCRLYSLSSLQVTLMQVVDTDIGKVTPTIWDAYKEIIRRFEPAVSISSALPS